jgi:hypothetical protein
MTRAQASGLVKKKQLGVLSGLHERLSAPVFVGKPACYPCSNPPIANDVALPVVEQSTIAQQPADGRQNECFRRGQLRSAKASRDSQHLRNAVHAWSNPCVSSGGLNPRQEARRERAFKLRRGVGRCNQMLQSVKEVLNAHVNESCREPTAYCHLYGERASVFARVRPWRH